MELQHLHQRRVLLRQGQFQAAGRRSCCDSLRKRHRQGAPRAYAQATRQVAFSPNIVSLEIQGPELPELSFFDLPGTINVVGEEDDPNDQGLVQRISKLVTTFLKDEKSLVLLACGKLVLTLGIVHS
jgi:hypothetical protein